MMKWQRDNFVLQAAFDKLPEDKREGKFPMGVLYQAEAPEYTKEYDKVIAAAQGKKGGN